MPYFKQEERTEEDDKDDFIYAVICIIGITIMMILCFWFYESEKQEALNKYKTLADCKGFQYNDMIESDNFRWFNEIPEVCRPISDERKRREKEQEIQNNQANETKNKKCLQEFLDKKPESNDCVDINYIIR